MAARGDPVQHMFNPTSMGKFSDGRSWFPVFSNIVLNTLLTKEAFQNVSRCFMWGTTVSFQWCRIACLGASQSTVAGGPTICRKKHIEYSPVASFAESATEITFASFRIKIAKPMFAGFFLITEKFFAKMKTLHGLLQVVVHGHTFSIPLSQTCIRTSCVWFHYLDGRTATVSESIWRLRV